MLYKLQKSWPGVATLALLVPAIAVAWALNEDDIAKTLLALLVGQVALPQPVRSRVRAP